MKKHILVVILTIFLTVVPFQIRRASINIETEAPIYYEGHNISDIFSGESTSVSNFENYLDDIAKTQVIIQTNSVYLFEDDRPAFDGYSSEEIIRILKTHRMKASEYYKEENSSLVKTLNLENLTTNITYSKYTPFIFLEFSEELSTYQISSISTLSTSSDVKAIYIQKIGTNSNQKSNELEDAIAAANGTQVVNAGIYDGTGIIIGVLDGGIIDTDNDNFDDTTVTIKQEAGNTEATHPTAVASILGGENGIAPGATLLSAQWDSFGDVDLVDLSDDIEWMIDNDVNVINMSIWDVETDNLGEYSIGASYLDYIIRNTWVTIVGSAGNRGAGDDLITSPKIGYNVITVGSVDNSGELSDFSSWEENFGISKPNLVAPGEDFSIPNLGNVGSGTSYSSPMVTGTIALLMDKKSLLMLYPEAINAIISSSTAPLEYDDFDTSGLEETIGTGMLDIEAALAATGTAHTTTNSSNHIGSYIFTKSVYLYAGQRIRIAAVQLVNSDQSTTPLVTNYDLFLVKSGLTVDSAQSTYNNIEFIDYVVPVTGYYYIKIKQISAKTTDHTDFFGMQYRVITSSC